MWMDQMEVIQLESIKQIKLIHKISVKLVPTYCALEYQSTLKNSTIHPYNGVAADALRAQRD
jgi:hypothetical protein